MQLIMNDQPLMYQKIFHNQNGTQKDMILIWFSYRYIYYAIVFIYCTFIIMKNFVYSTFIIVITEYTVHYALRNYVNKPLVSLLKY